MTLTPGQALDPLNDVVEQFSTLMLAASVAFGVQKILISIGSYWLISLVLTAAALAWTWLYFRQKQAPAWLSRTLVVLLMLRFAVPVVTIGTDPAVAEVPVRRIRSEPVDDRHVVQPGGEKGGTGRAAHSRVVKASWTR